MMQPEDKIQEIAERAERLQEIGNSIFLIRWMVRSMDLERMEE